jgi:hypothetical protein
MNRSQTSSYLQVAMILVAMALGAIMTQIVPERQPMAAYVPQTQVIPTTAVFKHARSQDKSHDRSHDLTGIEVDVRRLMLVAAIG